MGGQCDETNDVSGLLAVLRCTGGIEDRQPFGGKNREEQGEEVKVRASIGVLEKTSNRLMKKP